MLRCKIFKPFLLLCIAFPILAEAARKEITIGEMSSSGRTFKVNAGMNDGLHLREALLLRTEEDKIAAARVIRLAPEESIVYVVEAYGNMGLRSGDSYNILYGVPLDDIPDLPDSMSDINDSRDAMPDNPQDEKFFTPDGREISETPDVDDDRYTPEVSLRPKFPHSAEFNPHNITVGLGMFRNRDLTQTESSTSANRNISTYYTGYQIRYAYTFRTDYWLRKKTPALISIEAGIANYSFTHQFSSGDIAEIEVVPLFFNLRYLIEVSNFFRIYPYIGYQNNIVPSTSSSNASVRALSGGKLLGGAGFTLLLSKSVDARLDFGTDGILLGMVTKF